MVLITIDARTQKATINPNAQDAPPIAPIPPSKGLDMAKAVETLDRLAKLHPEAITPG